jgi:radical SAM-linked protein
MYGLPTETDEDIQAIVDMVRTISSTMRGKSPRLSLHVALSPFSPKANTPFQWEEMGAVEALGDKGRFIKRCLSDRKNVRVSYRDGRMTFLETVMARGDRRIGDVILEAWKAGARFDGWDERFNLDLWMEAAKAVGVDLELYTKSIDIDEALPWSAVSVGVGIDFLKRERERAFEGMATADCRAGECGNCGACDGGVSMRFCVSSPSSPSLSSPPPSPPTSTDVSTTTSTDNKISYGRRHRVTQEKSSLGHRYRLFFEKNETLRFLGHMDMVAVFHRAMIAAGFPLAFSQGFNPHPRVSFGPPLPFGAIGLNEAFDIETKSPLTGNPVDVNQWLPDGIKVKSCVINNEKASLSSTITAARYRIFPPRGFSAEEMGGMLEKLNGKTEIIVKREKDGRIVEKNIRPGIIKTSVHGNGDNDNQHYWEAVLSLTQSGSVSCKPSELISVLCPDVKISEFLICRVECI